MPSKSSSESEQSRSSKLPNLFSILRKIFEPVITQYIFLLTFIYLTVQFLAILGIIKEPYGIVPEPIRTYTIIIGTPLIILYIGFNVYNYVVYDWGEGKVKAIEKRFKISEKPKDPKIDIEENLTYRDVEFAISCLVLKLSKFGKIIRKGDERHYELDTEKNIIIGIDRGGAIVGGLLGKGLRLATKNVGIYWAHPSLVGVGVKTPVKSDKCLDSIDFDKVETVILVDDAIRTGKSMWEAIKVLEKKKEENDKYKKINYIIVCILDVYNIQKCDTKVKPDFCVYKYKSKDKEDTHKINLPWDVHWDTMKVKDELKELCDNVR